MKKIVLILIALSLYTQCLAQLDKSPVNKPSYDSILRRTLERNIQPPCDSCTGITMLLISKKDSIIFQTLYTSGKEFDLSGNTYLLRRLNERCNSFISEPYSVIIPVYFFTGETVVTDEQIRKAEHDTRRYVKKLPATKPVILVSYGTMRKADLSMQ